MNRGSHMIDVHSHLLPIIDDGSSSLEASIQLARVAVMEGITHSLVTPHPWTANTLITRLMSLI